MARCADRILGMDVGERMNLLHFDEDDAGRCELMIEDEEDDDEAYMDQDDVDYTRMAVKLGAPYEILLSDILEELETDFRTTLALRYRARLRFPEMLQLLKVTDEDLAETFDQALGHARDIAGCYDSSARRLTNSQIDALLLRVPRAHILESTEPWIRRTVPVDLRQKAKRRSLRTSATDLLHYRGRGSARQEQDQARAPEHPERGGGAEAGEQGE
jgi:hypothetical protein